MKLHTKIYLDHFNYDTSDFVPCECCNKKAVDIHHVNSRKMGGTKKIDTIDNLMALCRSCHIKYGDKKQFKEYLIEIHAKKLESL